MGFLSSVNSFLEDVSTTISHIPVIGQGASNAFESVVQAAENIIPGVNNSFTGSGTVGKIAASAAEHPVVAAAIVGTAGSATYGAATGTTTIGTQAVSLAGKAFTSASPLTKIGIIAAAPVAAGFISSNPSGTVKTILSTPAAAGKLGSDIGDFSKNPSLSGTIELAKNHPAATTLAAALAVFAGAKASSTITTGISAYETRQSVEATRDSISDSTSPVTTPIVNDKISVKDTKLQTDSSIEIAKINAANALDLAKEQTKQLELSSKIQTPAIAAVAPSSAAIAPTPITPTMKKTNKKKTATKKKITKKKAKPKKKAKSIKTTKKKKKK
jgi:hypothetical protein